MRKAGHRWQFSRVTGQSILWLVLLLQIINLTPSLAIAQEIRNADRSLVATIGEDGRVTDSSNRLLWTLDPAGTIRDSHRAVIGRYYSEGGVFTSKNSRVGTIRENGTVWDAQNRYLGKVSGEGVIYDERNRVVGYFKSNNLLEYALVWFFLIKKRIGE
jgi:hypothetical protein